MAGRIVRRSKSSWTLIYDLPRDPATGKRRQRTQAFRGTKRDAEAELNNLVYQRDNGVEPPPRRMTVAQYLARWQRDYVAALAPKTAQEYRRIIDRRLVPAFGALELTALRPVAIQSWYTTLLASGRVPRQPAKAKGGQIAQPSPPKPAGLSPKSVLRYHQVLHAALRQAVRWQLLIRNPADAVEPPKAPRRELRATTPEQARAVMEAADATGYGPLVRIAVLTGMRRGELLGLRWSDVDWSAPALSIQQTAQRIKGQGIVYRQPKTRLSRRSIALSPDAVATLKGHRKAQLEARVLAGPAYDASADLVFATGIGTPIEAGNLSRAWRRITVAAKVPGLRIHDLRHAHATLLLGSGVHPKVVSERLGHASVNITLDTYSHVLPGLQEAAALALDAVLAEPAPKGIVSDL